MGKREFPVGRPARGRSPYRWLVVLIGAVAISAGVVGWRGGAPSGPSEGPALSAGGTGVALARRETRPTLDPARFVGKAALAHAVAREIPDTLDRLYCYCECDKHMGHRSLLSCFTDGHAAT